MNDLSDKGQDYLQRVRALGPMIDAAVDQIDAARHVSRASPSVLPARSWIPS